VKTAILCNVMPHCPKFQSC